MSHTVCFHAEIDVLIRIYVLNTRRKNLIKKSGIRINSREKIWHKDYLILEKKSGIRINTLSI